MGMVYVWYIFLMDRVVNLNLVRFDGMGLHLMIRGFTRKFSVFCFKAASPACMASVIANAASV